MKITEQFKKRNVMGMCTKQEENKRFAKMVNLYSALAGALRVLLVQASVLKCSFSVVLGYTSYFFSSI